MPILLNPSIFSFPSFKVEQSSSRTSIAFDEVFRREAYNSRLKLKMIYRVRLAWSIPFLHQVGKDRTSITNAISDDIYACCVVGASVGVIMNVTILLASSVVLILP